MARRPRRLPPLRLAAVFAAAEALLGASAVADEGGAIGVPRESVRCFPAGAGGSWEELRCEGRLYRLAAAADGPPCASADVLPFGTYDWYVNFGLALLCVLCAATAAGLTLGLTSMDGFQLKVLCNQDVEDLSPRGSPRSRWELQEKLLRDQASAVSILPLISGRYTGPRSFGFRCLPRRLSPTNAHYLLVTLLVCNAGANEALPVVLDKLVPTWAAVVLSVTVVLVFGEIIPSALFTGPNQLTLAAKFARLVGLMKFVLMPIALPISLVLDGLMRTEDHDCNRAQIKALVRTMEDMGSPLEGEEVKMISGILEMHKLTCEEISTRLCEAKMLPHDTVITHDFVERLLSWGHSRIILYRRDPEDPNSRNDVVGVLMVKKLIGVSPLEHRRLDSVPNAVRAPIVVAPDENLLMVLRRFQEGMAHLALVSRDPAAALSAMEEMKPMPPQARPTHFCSMEDVLERIIKAEIFDEVDAELQRFRRGDSTSLSSLMEPLQTGVSIRGASRQSIASVITSFRLAEASARNLADASSSDDSEL